MIRLYGMSSPNVRKILIALEEIGLPYRCEHVAVFRGAQFDAEFLALNPMAKVPVLIDPDGPAGKLPLFESGAILAYLAETYAPQFFPEAGRERWDVMRWLMWQVANVGPAFGNHSHFRLQADSNPYAARRFRHMAAQGYRVLETRLSGRDWLAGGGYSIADMAVFPWSYYLERHGMDAAEFPTLLAWRARIAARPAVQRAAEAIRPLAEQDRLDRAAQTPDERDRFMGLHTPAPSAQAAARTRSEPEGN